MSLVKIDRVDDVDENQPPQKVLADVCRALRETRVRLMDVNNECISLRKELEALKPSLRFS
jgi:hypothetical protein